MRIAFVICLVLCAAASATARIDPGGDPSVPEEIRRSTFTADFVVKGTVESVEVAHAHLHAPVSFIGLRPQSFLKGEPHIGELVFYRFGDVRGEALSLSYRMPGVDIGDTVVVWLELDGRNEFFNRGVIAIRQGNVAWTPYDEYGPPSRSIEVYEEWARDLTEDRSLERLAVTSDVVVVGFVDALRYREIGGRSHSVVEVRVEQGLRGVMDSTTVDVVLPIHRDPVQRDFVDLPLGETALLFLALGDDGLYRVNGGSEGAFLIIQGTRCIPAPARGSPYPGLPCEIAGRASRYAGERRDLHVPDIERIVASAQEGATSN